MIPRKISHVAKKLPVNHVSTAHANLVCKVGQGREACRYLTATAGGFTCEKKSGQRATRDFQTQKDPNILAPRGDNCGGLPV